MFMTGLSIKRLGHRSRSSPSRRMGRLRLQMELLESRCLPATITVTNLFDDVGTSGVSLRDAIEAANTNTSVNGSTPGNPGPETIVFAPGLTGTILLNAPLTIMEPLTIQGLGAANTTISGQSLPTNAPTQRLFDITATAGDVTLDGIALTHGRTLGNNQNNPSGTP